MTTFQPELQDLRNRLEQQGAIIAQLQAKAVARAAHNEEFATKVAQLEDAQNKQGESSRQATQY